MAVLCAEHGLLFIGSKRTASTAVGNALVEQLRGVYVPRVRIELRPSGNISKRHSTIAQIEHYGLIQVELDSLLKVTTVRNPFDSLVSLWAKERFRENRTQSFTQLKRVDFSEWMWKKFNHREVISMNRDFVQGVDSILRFESLQDDLNGLLRSRGIPPVVLPVVNRTSERDRDYRKYYDDRAREVVERVFAPDIENFDYTF